MSRWRLKASTLASSQHLVKGPMAPPVGELLILGFRGLAVPAWLREFSARFGLGGVILFDYDWALGRSGRNVSSPAQVRELCGELAGLAAPPLVFVDQEGGRVRRLKEALGFAPLPSARDLAALPRERALELARASYAELASLGIHYNLAPVLDLDLNPDNPDIGAHGRAYSAQAPIVREMALLLDQAARAAGIGLCGKHFPGIGGATVNSHEALLALEEEPPAAQLELFYDLAPRLSGQAMLVSHAIVRSWDATQPACLSPAALGRLRARAPQALLLSDDLQMQGLQRHCSTPQALRQGLAAGLDLLLLGNNLLEEGQQCSALALDLERALEQEPALAARAAEARGRVAQRKAQFQRAT